MNIEQLNNLRLRYPTGTRVKLVYMGDDPQALSVGSLGTVHHVDDIGTIHVKWDCGSSLGIIHGVDEIRIVPEKVIVYKPRTRIQTNGDSLAKWANAVHKLAGGKGDVFKASDFPERLKGHHCHCRITDDGYSAGVFELLPLNSEEVKEGKKAYMQCIKCGGFSHL